MSSALPFLFSFFFFIALDGNRLNVARKIVSGSLRSVVAVNQSDGSSLLSNETIDFVFTLTNVTLILIQVQRDLSFIRIIVSGISRCYIIHDCMLITGTSSHSSDITIRYS